ncbi:MAG TPA: alpha/beta family hydrolase [Steroidobacteraceae bacterium]
MSLPNTEPATIRVDAKRQISTLLTLPLRPRASYVFAHGAGAGMKHPFMEAVAIALAMREIATLRFQFPYMESGSRRPDVPPLCHATVRAAVQEAARRCPGLPLIAGGRSFGGRMTSQAQAASALPGVRGLAFFGFPLHPVGRPSDARANHLHSVALPMLFLQGTRDELAELSLLHGVIDRLGPRATLKLMPDANHSFHVPARSGGNDAQLIEELANAFSDWLLAAMSS